MMIAGFVSAKDYINDCSFGATRTQQRRYEQERFQICEEFMLEEIRS